MVEKIGNIHLNGQRIAEFVFFDNGMAVVSIGRYAEQLAPKSIQVYNSWDEIALAYPTAEFRAFWDRNKRDLYWKMESKDWEARKNGS